MTKIHSFKVDKLIRDKLPDIIQKEPETFLEYQILDDKSYIKALKDKLIEESMEVQEASTQDEILDELSDVWEVFESIVKFYSFSLREIEERKNTRKDDRGGFEDKVYCHSVSVSSKNPERLDYYKARPNQYPEIKKPANSV